jgi:hypothetical protein
MRPSREREMESGAPTTLVFRSHAARGTNAVGESEGGWSLAEPREREQSTEDVAPARRFHGAPMPLVARTPTARSTAARVAAMQGNQEAGILAS